MGGGSDRGLIDGGRGTRGMVSPRVDLLRGLGGGMLRARDGSGSVSYRSRREARRGDGVHGLADKGDWVGLSAGHARMGVRDFITWLEI